MIVEMHAAHASLHTINVKRRLCLRLGVSKTPFCVMMHKFRKSEICGHSDVGLAYAERLFH